MGPISSVCHGLFGIFLGQNQSIQPQNASKNVFWACSLGCNFDQFWTHFRPQKMCAWGQEGFRMKPENIHNYSNRSTQKSSGENSKVHPPRAMGMLCACGRRTAPLLPREVPLIRAAGCVAEYEIPGCGYEECASQLVVSGPGG